MSIKLLQTSALAMLIGLASVNIQAASIWLEPVSQDTTAGGIGTIKL